MARFRISDDAQGDLIEIWVYIATHSVRQADRVNASIQERFATLGENPMMGRARPELLPNLRSFPE